MTVFLYDTRRKVELTLRESPSGVVNWNLPMNTNDFRVFKDVYNSIEFVVRNTDRKPINMMGRSAEINLYDQRTSKLLHNTPLKVINEAKGICTLEIAPDITSDWFLQTYSYSVVVTNADGTRHMLYVDQNESQRGFFELMQGPSFDPHPSFEISWEQFSLTSEYIDSNHTSLRYSTAFPGSMQRNNTSGLHTLVAYFNNFSGTLKIQGSVEDGSPTLNDWYDIKVLELDKKTGVEAVSFEANLMWVRFWVLNKADNQDAPLESIEGEITKLVFRN